MSGSLADTRLAYVQSLLEGQGLKASQITAIAYLSELDNNFVYRIDLSEPLSESTDGTSTGLASRQPGTSKLTPGTTRLIVHLSNTKADGINNANRVENAVASMWLVRNALKATPYANVIPPVYAWAGPSGDQLGWVLSEFKDGEQLDEAFEELDIDKKRDIINQFADILGAIQRIDLGSDVTHHGGLKFSTDGKIVTGESPWLPPGIFSTIEEILRGRAFDQLQSSDNSDILKGWKANGLRERVERFFKEGLSKYLADHRVDQTEKVLCHGDFTTNNTLFDKPTNKITALLDFDFARIEHPSAEFFSGFHDFGGSISGGPGNAAMRNAIISGFAEATSDPEFELPKIWNSALVERSIHRPSTILGIGAIGDIEWLKYILYPHSLTHPMVLARRRARGDSDSVIEKERAEKETQISNWLEAQGF